ncbi:Ku protein [Burkholderia plantarii]|uniref:non-homologous end joining protein Ku n=1 Tax=Burkholderia plantarii TaxID=41899 RepID=UPI0006D8C021|nr:Ku protein [Burkholderia plantarii]ALK29915.1 Ku domain-containing protein [Burkholderia plantarii]GLZ20841.1 non-homologous end joining protein Ku [Burkholderia plantarii]
MPAMIWRGAISFGLVHVPVRLVPATRTVKPSFRMLDRRSLDPIGYRRVNKRTGREVAREDIVRGYEYEKERFVVLGDDEIQAANPESTQSVDILTFVDTSAVSFLYLDTPYYLLPERNGEKVYALLRDALAETGRVGIALVVMRERQHLAALIPVGEVLALDTLRWQDELRGLDELSGGKGGKRGASASAQERRMARKLIEDMSGDWAPDEYHDTFRDDILALVERKVKAGKTKTIETPHADAPAKTSSNVLDLTELLRRSLGGGGRRGAGKDAGEEDAGRVRNGKAAGRKTAAGKPAARAAAKPARAAKTSGTSSRSKPAVTSAGKPAAKTAAKKNAKKDAKPGASRKSAGRSTSAAPASRKRAA